MKAVLINPPSNAGNAIAGLLNHKRSPFTNIAWLAGYYPGWSNDGLKLGLEPKELLGDDSGESLFIVKDPPLDLASTLLRYLSLPKAYAFSGRFPKWAKDLRNGNPELWGKTSFVEDDVSVNVAVEIEVLPTMRIAPEIREHLI